MSKSEIFISFKKCIPLMLILLASAIMAKPIPVAVMDFTNLTNDHEYNYLQKAVAELMVTDLIVCKEIQLIERSKLAEIMKELGFPMTGVVDSTKIVKAGKQVGAHAIILGSILKAGSSFRIDCRMTDVSTGEITLAEKVEWGSEDDIIKSVDLLAMKIIKKLAGQEISIGSQDSAPTTPSGTEKAVAMEVSLDNSFKLVGSDRPIYLQVDLFSKEVELKERIPLNISMVIDRSGSMSSQKKFEYVQQAAKFVVNSLAPTDILSVVTYESLVNIPIRAQKVKDKNHIIKVIESLSPNGSTFLSGGMNEGYRQVRGNQKSGQVNRVLLLSDGLANKGIQHPVKLREICRKEAEEGVSISTFGVGLDYNEDLMMNLSEYGNGNYYFIDAPGQIPTIFAQELKGLLSVSAQNVAIDIEIPKHIKVHQIIGYKSQSHANKKTITIGDMYSNEHRSIVIALNAPPDWKDSLLVAKVHLRYDDAATKKPVQELSEGCFLHYTKDKALVTKYEDLYVAQNANYMASNENMQRAATMVSNGEYEKARAFLDEEISTIQKAAAKYQTNKLKKQVLSVHQYRESLEGFEKMKLQEQKKIQKASKFRSYKKLKSKK